MPYNRRSTGFSLFSRPSTPSQDYSQDLSTSDGDENDISEIAFPSDLQKAVQELLAEKRKLELRSEEVKKKREGE